MIKDLTRTAIILLLILMTPYSAADSRPAPGEISPQELVRDTSSRMLSALRDERETIAGNPAHLYDLVSKIVLPYFDFRRMSQWVLGKNWRIATPEQREQFVVEFRTLLVRTYGNALLNYADEKIIYLPFVQDSTARTVTVRTEIEQGGSTIPISYSMYNSSDGWKVYDVSISGVSLVTNYRSTFGNIIREEGMSSLIKQLVERNGMQSDA